MSAYWEQANSEMSHTRCFRLAALTVRENHACTFSQRCSRSRQSSLKVLVLKPVTRVQKCASPTRAILA